MSAPPVEEISSAFIERRGECVNGTSVLGLAVFNALGISKYLRFRPPSELSFSEFMMP
jgi:hypothetical protein